MKLQRARTKLPWWQWLTLTGELLAITASVFLVTTVVSMVLFLLVTPNG